jgi:hypothetical protein
MVGVMIADCVMTEEDDADRDDVALDGGEDDDDDDDDGEEGGGSWHGRVVEGVGAAVVVASLARDMGMGERDEGDRGALMSVGGVSCRAVSRSFTAFLLLLGDGFIGVVAIVAGGRRCCER